ncbi:MAG: hypothetical protein ACI9NQ_000647 [Paracoccaceae bacterium]|jgi:hypothetical protein
MAPAMDGRNVAVVIGVDFLIGKFSEEPEEGTGDRLRYDPER